MLSFRNEATAEKTGLSGKKKNMKLFTLFLSVMILASCRKSAEQTPATCEDTRLQAWIDAKKAEYGGCFCKVQFVQGIYNNTPTIEIRLVDPLCDGINVVFKAPGTEWFNSSNQEEYLKYLAALKESSVIWSCAG